MKQASSSANSVRGQSLGLLSFPRPGLAVGQDFYIFLKDDFQAFSFSFLRFEVVNCKNMFYPNVFNLKNNGAVFL